MDKLLKQRVEILAQEVDKMKAGEREDCVINNSRIYVQPNEPSDNDIPEGSTWAKGADIKEYIIEDNIFGATIEQGAISNVDGLNVPNSQRVRSTFDTVIYDSGKYTISADGAAAVIVMSYDQNQKFIGDIPHNQWGGLPYTFEITQPMYLRLMFRAAGDAPIAPSDVSNVTLKLEKWSASQKMIELIDGGAKNIIKMFDSFTSVPEGLTVTKNSDETITLNGNVTSAAYIHIGSISAKAGTYRMLSSSVIFSENVVSFMYTHDNHMASDGKRETYTYQSDWNTDIVLYCPANTTYNNTTYWPMICTLADWNVSQAYQPYRPSYQELYEMVLALQTTRTATTRKTTKTKTNEE